MNGRRVEGSAYSHVKLVVQRLLSSDITRRDISCEQAET